MFKVGDRVVAIRDYGNVRKGDTGKIVHIVANSNPDIGVRWNREDWGFHNCSGNCENKHGYYVEEGDIKLQETSFKVGDRVQFKSLEELKAEFGEKIEVTCGWNSEGAMDHLCGTFATISRIDGKHIDLKDFTTTGSTNWAYSTDMIKHVEDKPQKTPKKPQSKNPQKLTEQELKILTSTDKKYIARDLDGMLFAYSERPVKDIGGQQWYSSKPYKEIRERNLFMFITWDSSPVEIKILLKGGENERN